MGMSVRQPRIYLVEASAILLRLLRELLQSVGAEVIGVSQIVRELRFAKYADYVPMSSSST